MSISLIAVFIPILLMGGIVGRLFREFAVTMSMAIGISMVVSLTAHAHDVRPPAASSSKRRTGGCTGSSERAFGWMVDIYGRTLARRPAPSR